MSKQIVFGELGRLSLGKGVNIATKVAAVTIGPKGRNVMLDGGVQFPHIVNDGLAAVREVILADRIQNMGADIIRDVALKTNDKAGGGRTASILLTGTIFSEGMKVLGPEINAIALKKGIEKAASGIIEQLKKKSIPVTTNDEIRNIATISSESSNIGKQIADAVKLIGTEGIITVEESPISLGVSIETTDGMKVDRGWISPYMITNYEKNTAEYTDVAVIITDSKLKPIIDIQKLLGDLGEVGKREILIIAEDIEGETLNTILLNKAKGGLNIVGIKTPGFGMTRKEILEDIATLTGATVISEDKGMKLSEAKLNMVGFAKKIIIGRETSIIIGNPAQRQNVADRVISLKKQKIGLTSKIDIQTMDSRIAKLSGGVAVIKVGAATETGMRYLKLKIEDAVSEVKAAMEEGIIAGGGSTLVTIADSLCIDCLPADLTTEEKLAYGILQVAITMPFKQIVVNSGGDVDRVLEELKVLTTPNKGFNAVTGKVTNDMVAEGIIDSVKVVRIALENAAEAAATLLTTEVVVADENMKKE